MCEQAGIQKFHWSRRKAMRIITCFKVVPEEQDISVQADRTLSLEKAEPKISPYDLNAVEAAVQIKETATDVTITGLSVGGKKFLEHQKVRKDILSRGPDSLVLAVDDAFAGLLPAETAAVLASAATKVGFDLILCGEGSGDLYAQQVGVQLGQKLGVPTVNAVSRIVLKGSLAEVERTLENEVETLEIPLPAVLSVTSDINTPRLPSMKTILAAAKKPVQVFTATELGGEALVAQSKALSVQAPQQRDRRGEIIADDSDNGLAAFTELVKKALS
jgi:electron transfer flavoprotein beta subunit